MKDIVNQFKGVVSQERTRIRRQAADKVIARRLRQKKAQKEPVNVVFVCHRPAVWESLHSVYDALVADPHFHVTIVAIPNKVELPGVWFDHEEYHSEGAEEFWKDYGCINGYNYETGEWLDLKELKPDYVFFQQPYNVTRCPAYRSKAVSRYARIAYIDYFVPLAFGEIYVECTPADYLRDLSFFFTQNEKDTAFIQNRFKSIPENKCAVVNTGFPRYDHIQDYANSECSFWNDQNSFKIIWTPRWTTNEGNCHFFDYKDSFTRLCKDMPEIELAFRPHPQAFKEWEFTGEFTKEQREAYLREFEHSNMHLDQSGNYLPLLFHSDCLVTDRSSIITDYLCTYKPVIYCAGTDSAGSTVDIEEAYLNAMYTVKDWHELREVLDMLMHHEDPLLQTRKETVEQYFGIGTQHAAENVKKILLADAMK